MLDRWVVRMCRPLVRTAVLLLGALTPVIAIKFLTWFASGPWVDRNPRRVPTEARSILGGRLRKCLLTIFTSGMGYLISLVSLVTSFLLVMTLYLWVKVRAVVLRWTVDLCLVRLSTMCVWCSSKVQLLKFAMWMVLGVTKWRLCAALVVATLLMSSGMIRVFVLLASSVTTERSGCI